MKNIKIENCHDCPYFTIRWDEYNDVYIHCCRYYGCCHDRRIAPKYKYIIPKWCPLEDYKEEDNANHNINGQTCN